MDSTRAHTTNAAKTARANHPAASVTTPSIHRSRAGQLGDTAHHICCRASQRSTFVSCIEIRSHHRHGSCSPADGPYRRRRTSEQTRSCRHKRSHSCMFGHSFKIFSCFFPSFRKFLLSRDSLSLLFFKHLFLFFPFFSGNSGAHEEYFRIFGKEKKRGEDFFRVFRVFRTSF